MPRMGLSIGSMNSDSFGWAEEGSWYVENLTPFGETYQTVGKVAWDAASQTLIADTELPQNTYIWKTDYNTYKTFYTTNTTIFEIEIAKLRTGLTAPTYGYYFAPFGPTLFATNGVDPIQIRSTTAPFAFANITVPSASAGPPPVSQGANPRPKFLIAFKNQLVGANITIDAADGAYGALPVGTYKHLVWWSSRGNGELWGTDSDAPEYDGSNYIPIFDDSIEITGLAAGEDAVFVFKEHSIYRLDGPDFSISPVSLTIGCIAPRTICKATGTIYFLSQNGIYALNTASNELRNLSIGKVSRTLTGTMGIPVETLRFGDPARTARGVNAVGIKTGDTRISMAVDPDNRFLCMCYLPFGTGSYYLLSICNIDTEQFSFACLDAGTGKGDLLVHTGPRLDSTNYPLGRIAFSARELTAV